MKFSKLSELFIAPEAEKIIQGLPADLKDKVKNALREISRGEESGTALGVTDARQLYKAGRFRIFYRRENGSVWIDALSLDPVMGGRRPE